MGVGASLISQGQNSPQSRRRVGDLIGARWVANQIAVERAIEKTGAKRAITFHSRVSSAKEFSSDSSHGIKQFLPEFSVFHVNGDQKSSERKQRIRSFRDAEALILRGRGGGACYADNGALSTTPKRARRRPGKKARRWTKTTLRMGRAATPQRSPWVRPRPSGVRTLSAAERAKLTHQARVKHSKLVAAQSARDGTGRFKRTKPPQPPPPKTARRTRSRVTNGSKLFMTGPAHSPAGRRLGDLLRQILSDAGGVSNLSEAEQQLCRRAATLSVACERLEESICNGGSSAAEQAFMSATGGLSPFVILREASKALHGIAFAVRQKVCQLEITTNLLSPLPSPSRTRLLFHPPRR